MNFNNRILVAITGGIAAYKAAELIRLLQKNGALVKVIMTKGAQAFITPLTIQALTGSLPHTKILDEKAEAGMGHIELARWSELIIIAPASANAIAKIALGQADDLMSTVLLASKSPIAVVPAMNEQMWAKQSVADNIAKLRRQGHWIWGPATGEQACGDNGLGRMLEPLEILGKVNKHFSNGILAGKTVVITGGPTREKIDPVRYISNYSSGKMAYALAIAAQKQAANVILISGPVNLKAPKGVTVVNVQSADAMLASAEQHTANCDIFIAAAAVADYKVAEIKQQKMKKNNADSITLELVKNSDILKTIAEKLVNTKALIVGFAAETQNVIEYAKQKLVNKKLDLIIANDVSDTNIGFESDNNQVVIISNSDIINMAITSKLELAEQLIVHFSENLK